MSTVKKILIIRNDKIGDFVLALPAIRLIKQAFPNAIVTVLVPAYTSEIALSFSWIDDIIIDSKQKKNKKKLVSIIKEKNFDAVICFFSDSYNASLVFRANIPVRIAPATKWVQFLYTHTLRQRRSKSIKPEYEYNLDLARYFVEILGGNAIEDKAPMFTYTNEVRCKQLNKLACIGANLKRQLCFIHPVTGGSSNTLTIDQWTRLICFLNKLDEFYFLITAGPGESSTSQILVDALEHKVPYICLYDKNDGIEDFMRSIATASLFIAGSTGPLHIAGALDIPTIGFYPKKRSSTSLRWRTLNSPENRLSLSPGENEETLTDMNVEKIFSTIETWYQNMKKL